jgi:hypothetical protein
LRLREDSGVDELLHGERADLTIESPQLQARVLAGSETSRVGGQRAMTRSRDTG